MIDYTISKIGEDIILTLPAEKVTYYNEYNHRTYTNCSNGITLTKTLITHSYLENIKIQSPNISDTKQEDITLQFRTTTGNVININCGEDNTELQTNIDKATTITDFYLDAVITKKLLLDFMNTVLVEVYTNEEVLDQLGADEITLTISSQDTETLENGEIIVTASDKNENPIKDLQITGNVGDLAVSETTDSDGVISVELEGEGTYNVSFTSKATSEYKSATAEDTITATTKNEVTLTISTEDTETLENGLIIVTATGEDGEPISDLEITGNVGDLAVSETTDNDGVVSVELEAEGTYPVMFTSKATSEYKSATAEDTITATIAIPKTEVEIRIFAGTLLVSFIVLPVGGSEPVNGIQLVGTVGDIPVDGVTENNALVVRVPSAGTYAVDVHSVATSEYASATYTGEANVTDY